MTNELIPIEPEIIPDKPKQLSLEDLPPLNPQQAKMLNYILEGYSYTAAYKKANYTSEEYAANAAWTLVNRDPLKSHLCYFVEQNAKCFTPAYKLKVLNKIIENATNPDSDCHDYDAAIKAIDIMNKMAGDYASTTNIQVNNINASLDDIRNAKSEYKSDK